MPGRDLEVQEQFLAEGSGYQLSFSRSHALFLQNQKHQTH